MANPAVPDDVFEVVVSLVNQVHETFAPGGALAGAGSGEALGWLKVCLLQPGEQNLGTLPPAVAAPADHLLESLESALADLARRWPEAAPAARTELVNLLPPASSEMDPGQAIPPPPSLDTLHGMVIPGYQLLEELGRGSMGVVYRARALVGEQRLVAIKLMLNAVPWHDPLARVRFTTEAEAVARLQHEGIVNLYEVGAYGECPYTVLELVEGGRTLKEELSLQGRFAPDRAARLVMRLAEAMGHAHERAVVHRDLKPANILLTTAGDPKITDFGVAKLTDALDDRTETGVLLGTPAYMAPEQAQGQANRAGPATDVHALGVILYELLAGKPPFQALTSNDIIAQILRERPKPLRQARPGTPPDLETIVLKCLEKAPADRYASARHLEEELSLFLAGQRILTPRPGRLERARQWVREHPRQALIGLAVSGTALGFAVLFAWALSNYWEADAQRADALAKKTEAQIQTALAETQTGLATANANKLQVVNAVLKKLLGAPFAPDFGGLGPDVTVAQWLALQEAEVQGIQARHPGQPALWAEIYRVFAETLLLVGEHGKAEKYARQAVGWSRTTAGPEAAPTLAAEILLGQILLAGEDPHQALGPIETTLAACRRTLGPGHQDTLTCRWLQALAWDQLGDYAKAEPEFQATRNAAVANHGAASTVAVGCGIRLARLYLETGQLARAEQVLGPTLEGAAALSGPTSVQAWQARHQLANLRARQGRFPEAVTLLREAYAGMRARVPANHLFVLVIQRDLAVALDFQGQPEEAETLARDAWDLAQARYPDRHRASLTFRGDFAIRLLNHGKTQAALGHLRELHEQYTALRRQGDYPRLKGDHATCLVEWARGLIAQNQLPEAAQALKQALELLKGTLPATHPVCFQARFQLAALLVERGALRDGEDRFQALYQDLKAAQGESHPDTLTCFVYLLKARVGRGPLSATDLRQLQALGEALSRSNPNGLLSWRIQALLAVDHVQRGQAAQAERLAGQAAPALERLCGPASGLVLETRNTWACALHLLNRLPEAEREFTIVHRGLKTAYGPGSPQALVALFSLASVAADAGKHAEAVTRFQELIDVVGKAPEGGRRLVVLRTHQALSLAETGDPAKAETQLRECLAQLQKQPGSRDQDTLWVRLYLGRALYLQGRYAEAEPCLRRGQELLAAEAGYSEYRKQRALQWLGDLYQAWGQPAEAARWHDQARELGASRPQPP